ncbi:hypothetical protein BJ322DRAFT_1052836 [Thelephora terrestris]|uniref:Uncharacterized protein n=1 Tax=Thelephora terrestris TaxID=56493 RepID=A0A9P6L8A1_9AGAM|nr:hypothetical protein BJ322DRAFT_1052836 [Thelephora terrestris]
MPVCLAAPGSSRLLWYPVMIAREAEGSPLFADATTGIFVQETPCRHPNDVYDVQPHYTCDLRTVPSNSLVFSLPDQVICCGYRFVCNRLVSRNECVWWVLLDQLSGRFFRSLN